MDPISDFINRIKNAQKAGHEKMEVSFSNMKFELAKILNQENLIGQVERKGAKSKERLEIGLRYEEGAPAIQEVRRISKPGQRIYRSNDKIRPVKQGYGLAIISTSRGLMTDKNARKQKIGGEILCEIW
ncbi:MAG: 30S ribosomal protein S8 [Parcubacteria group bacterium GW2011_GWA1_42_7]|nr:MAG: 30S ribosomal protein S8 [Parcubacteria group bacterium GW2011_GWB1_42_6]KKS69599.1 MAG: 30S ribosomal protein S8 [Parcubacteria group bacterium GW2011_GWA1_42_7]KKS92151.1 MAG: 30S ribosomal protein S8 [Parcubacteria group bacterium GW2011_GWC1_43_12]